MSSQGIAIKKVEGQPETKINNEPNMRVSAEANESKPRPSFGQGEESKESKDFKVEVEIEEEFPTLETAPAPSPPPLVTTPFSVGVANSSKDKQFFADKLKLPKVVLGLSDDVWQTDPSTDP